MFINRFKINNNHQNKIYYNLKYFSTSQTIIKPPPYNILFFGTDNVSLPILKALNENKTTRGDIVKELQVVCPKSKKREEVESYSIQNNIKITHPDEEKGMKGFQVPTTESNQQPFDLAVVVSFGHFIPKSVLSQFKYGGLNMHPSLLPRHRGAAPIYHTILKDDKEAGISIIELHPERFDCGKILSQVKLNNYDNSILYNQLLNQLSNLGTETLMETLQDFPNKSMNSFDQPEQGKTLASKVNKDISKVNWENSTQKEIWIHYRAFSDNISLHGMIYNKKYKTNKRIKFRKMLPPLGIYEAHDLENKTIYQSLETDLESYYNRCGGNSQIPFGTYFLETDKSKPYSNILWTKCKDGWVGFTELYEEGKKNDVKAHEFIFGKNTVSINNNKETIPQNQVVI
ncbi:hypothetical protein DICPUDRAFT_84478 [Dictyostelium purpureum]|uniref:methionyl-tRNA formyltransferase n=1 Tax=Dictyostelium purpureum TaxID=5786 RepID=F1A2S5_DICPU|nr:uncharacterized protein DICPUDRAFT_84478 [Dictyostelium purpureum]EGC29509.1 hypothetical protein DICPUDRAFT_84478 [Dictyostelium purpureum]|eukprot:XP_003293969.1 hypothetical protein DICPUDRAFT_84478 [Dictyostelium purpureum]